MAVVVVEVVVGTKTAAETPRSWERGSSPEEHSSLSTRPLPSPSTGLWRLETFFERCRRTRPSPRKTTIPRPRTTKPRRFSLVHPPPPPPAALVVLVVVLAAAFAFVRTVPGLETCHPWLLENSFVVVVLVSVKKITRFVDSIYQRDNIFFVRCEPRRRRRPASMWKVQTFILGGLTYSYMYYAYLS
jgi:hypothetical protein